jgi:tubulin polyglutamylase TTLL1
VHTARSLFGSTDAAQRLQDDQILNHFPTHLELTRKDLMVKNLKRYRRDIDKLGQTDATSAALAAAAASSAASTASMTVAADGSAQAIPAAQPLIDFFPLTYTLPGEFAVFADEFRRSLASASAAGKPPGSVVWIVKPNAKSQGKGIELLHKQSQLKKWAAAAATAKSAESGPGGAAARAQGSYVVSRYIADPLLIGGRKFDLRLYCLVTRYRPTLKAWAYREGFARFTNVKYSSSAGSLSNPEMHLTNVAIQKHGDSYNDEHGNKWSLANLKLYLTATRGAAATQACFEQMDFVFLHALRAVAPVMSGDKHCFELYGVNASPSLSVTTRSDRALKTKLIADLLRVVVPPDFPDTKTSRGSTSWNNAMQVGGFELLYDEALMASVTAGSPNAAAVTGSAAGGPMGSPWDEFGLGLGGGGGGASGPSRAGAAFGAGRPATAGSSLGAGAAAAFATNTGAYGAFVPAPAGDTPSRHSSAASMFIAIIDIYRNIDS